MDIELTAKEKIKKLILPDDISKELAYFCGVLAGDGSIRFQESKHQYEIKCVGNPADEKGFYDKKIKKLIKYLFNLDIKTKYFDSKTTYGFNICSRSLVKYLTEIIGLPLGKKYDKLKIPDIFIKYGFVEHFVRGVADTDFHLAIRRKNYPIISGVSKSKTFLEEIRAFLESKGFRVSMYKREDFDKRVEKVVITYRIELYGHEQFKKWMKEIGFSHPKNQQKIKIILAKQ